MSSQTSISPILPQRPVALDYLIEELGQYLGIEGLVFDDENRIHLSFDEIEFAIEYVSDAVGLIFQSIVGPLPDEDELDLYRWLNKLNGVSFRVGAGILTLIPDTQDILWADRLASSNLTVETLNQALNNAIRNVRTWREAIEEASTPDLAETELDIEESAMIRI